MCNCEISKAYEDLKNEVAEVRDYVRRSLVPGTREEELYKGTMILYSQLIKNPDFLFIGINPGAGFFRSTGIKYRPEELDPEDGFEYVLAENEYDYDLARQTRTAFGQTKFRDCLSRCVKTNLFYTSTSNQNEMHELFSIINSNLKINYYDKSVIWTKRLINIFEPKIIICEGKSVVDRLSAYYGVEPNWNQHIATFQIQGNVRVLGYKRRYSRFRNIDEFVATLNSL
jgi:hypothetical protein